MVDVSHFDPSEISVKTTDNNIVVHGKFVYLALGVVKNFVALLVNSYYFFVSRPFYVAEHKERNDQYGTVSREYVSYSVTLLNRNKIHLRLQIPPPSLHSSRS